MARSRYSEELDPATFGAGMLVGQQGQGTPLLQMGVDCLGAPMFVNHVLPLGSPEPLNPIVEELIVQFSCNGKRAEAHQTGEVATNFKISEMAGDRDFGATA